MDDPHSETRGSDVMNDKWTSALLKKRGSDTMNQMDKFHSERGSDQVIVSNPNRNIPGLETQNEFIIFIIYDIIPGISDEKMFNTNSGEC